MPHESRPAHLLNVRPTLFTTVLTIVEILSRSEQGVTRPFLCRCDDDRLYYVKGRNAGTRSLICEWLAGNLAGAFGLPIAPFKVDQAPAELVELLPEGRELGTASAFGSERISHAQEFTVSHLSEVPLRLQRDMLVFDWWVRNQDRTLTKLSGNPNLLWDAREQRLAVIDHNLAFDLGFDAIEFSEAHVFSAQFSAVFRDLAECAEYSHRLSEALATWNTACETLPPEWWFVDEEQTVPTDFDPVAALTALNRCTSEDFRRLPP